MFRAQCVWKLVQFADKEGKPNPDLRCSGESVISDQRSLPLVTQAYRGERGHMVFFDGKHEDCKNQIGRDEHFDEYALSWVDSLL